MSAVLHDPDYTVAHAGVQVQFPARRPHLQRRHIPAIHPSAALHCGDKVCPPPANIARPLVHAPL